ncbi:MAG TPA: magnesium transporter CorA family protein [Opitutaceae bacterium]|nr:magnesium transporter CorA family protein [Opitutaceae bacterium]
MITTLVYRDTRLAATDPAVETLAALRTEPGVMIWVDLATPTEDEIKQVLQDLFAFHPLAIEDCVADTPLPKLEDYDDHLYLVMHAVDYSQTAHFTTTELDIFLGKTFLVTFHRQPLKSVEAALDRFRRAPSTLVRGPDRFLQVILDLMVEAYQPALAQLRKNLERMEEGALRDVAAAELFPQVIALRKDLSNLRKIVRPQREIAAELAQSKGRFIRAHIAPYLRDLTGELVRIETQATAWAEQVVLSFRIYLNKSGYQANQGIRVLTALTAITLPAVLVGGWYGMNFEAMPELTHGYAWAIGATFGTTLLMVLFLKKKKWF